MPYSKDELYATIAPRPRKIAFLIDPDDCPDALLDSIYEFNTSHWGGRYNPIIPVVKGKINDSYWALLKFSDPDIIYAYAKPTKSLIDKIDREISPFHFILHKDRYDDSAGPYRYRIDMYGQLSSRALYPVFNKIFKQDPFFNPSLFVYNGSKKTADYRLVLRNFGVINDTALSDKVPQEISVLKIEKDSDLSQVIKGITETRSLVTPFQLAENSAYHYEAEFDRQSDCFFIYVGDNIWNWIHCWNRNIILPRWRRSQILQICLPVSVFNDDAFKNNLAEFLSNKFWSSGNHPGTVYFVSNEINEAELKKISSSMPHKGNFFHAELCIDAKVFPKFSVIFKDGGLLRRSKQIQLTGEHMLLQNIKPDFLKQDAPNLKWMLDLAITYRPEKFTYTNVSYWWKLPKRSGVTNLFIRGVPGRITSEGMISVESDSKNQNMELTIPRDRSVIQSYIFNYGGCFYIDDIRCKDSEAKHKRGIKKDIKISDKGGYARGVLDMFPNLFEAAEFIKNRYWRSIIAGLCNIDMKDNEKYLKPIINKLDKKFAELRENLQGDPEEAKKWLANFIYNKAKELRTTKSYIAFSEMLYMLKEEREEFVKKQQNPRGFDISERTNENDLRDSLSSLTDRGIFEQGFNITCSFCGTTFWYGVDELKKEVNCKGCRTANQIPVEARWTYKLNELLRNAVAFHGVLPSIWALGEMLDMMGGSFIYLTGLELYKSYESKNPYRELDLACIVDGKFVIGEIKSCSDDLGKREVQDFAELCREIMPQRAVICVLRDPGNRLKKIVESLGKELKQLDIEVAGIRPDGYFFEPAYHI